MASVPTDREQAAEAAQAAATAVVAEEAATAAPTLRDKVDKLLAPKAMARKQWRQKQET